MEVVVVVVVEEVVEEVEVDEESHFQFLSHLEDVEGDPLHPEKHFFFFM